MEKTVSNLEEMKDFAATFVTSLVPREDGAVVVALSGDLGAGKTTFTQFVATVLGITEQVTSPTYVLEKVYQLQGQCFERLVHVDAYRLHEAHELEVLGWSDILRDPKTLIVLEWPEKVASIVPTNAIRITLEGTDSVRVIRYDN